MRKALEVMGASISSNTPKEIMASAVVRHLKDNAEYVWFKLTNESREILKRLAESDSDCYVERPHDNTHFTEIEQSTLVVTYFPSKKEDICRYYMIDEVREILKKVIADNSDVKEVIDIPFIKGIDDLRGHEFTSYSCSYPLMEDIRKADYKMQGKLCLALRKYFLDVDDSWNFDMFVGRFMETSGNIDPRNIEDTIEWITYSVNDMDNAIMVIDRHDPMAFFHLALHLEKIIKAK